MLLCVKLASMKTLPLLSTLSWNKIGLPIPRIINNLELNPTHGLFNAISPTESIVFHLENLINVHAVAMTDLAVRGFQEGPVAEIHTKLRQ